MRIFYSFLIMMSAVILILLPVTTGVYDIKTDKRTDVFPVTTGVGADNTTVQLHTSIYDNDVATLSFESNDTDDEPYYYSYNTTTRALMVAGLAASTTRTLEVQYDIDAISEGSIDTFFDVVPMLFFLMIGAFAVGSLVAIWTGRAD